ncbi:MAG TPA: hypothetical protein PKA64_24335 [Myxococcota bacterium]|nr:hypothetical protein [Myxococcota bacterium]
MSVLSRRALRGALVLSASLLATSSAHASCVYRGSAGQYVTCIYDAVLANAADILDLTNRVDALDADVARMGRYYTRQSSVNVSPGYYGTINLGCNPGDQLISGGVSIGGGFQQGMAGEHITGNGPNAGMTAWTGILYNDTHNTGWNVDILFTTTVICLDR